MAAIANAIDFFQEELLASVFTTEKSEANRTHSSTNLAGLRAMLYATYAMMIMVILYVHDIALIQWREGWSWLSFSYFCGSSAEFLGLISLALKVHATKSVAGVSAQSLVLYITSLTFRLFSTMVFEGYLPVDRSGDQMLQIVDTCSLVTALYLLHACQKKYVHTYQEEHDTMPIEPMLLSCVILSYFIRGSLNRSLIFDMLWAFSLDVEVIQLVPQLFMMAKVGGQVDTATAHFVVNMVLACLCRFVFWIWAIPGCKELSSPEGYSWDMQMGGIYILCAYIIQTLISLDFMYYYVKSWWVGQKTVYLPKAGEEI